MVFRRASGHQVDTHTHDPTGPRPVGHELEKPALLGTRMPTGGLRAALEDAGPPSSGSQACPRKTPCLAPCRRARGESRRNALGATKNTKRKKYWKDSGHYIFNVICIAYTYMIPERGPQTAKRELERERPDGTTGPRDHWTTGPPGHTERVPRATDSGSGTQ